METMQSLLHYAFYYIGFVLFVLFYCPGSVTEKKHFNSDQDKEKVNKE